MFDATAVLVAIVVSGTRPRADPEDRSSPHLPGFYRLSWLKVIKQSVKVLEISRISEPNFRDHLIEQTHLSLSEKGRRGPFRGWLPDPERFNLR